MSGQIYFGYQGQAPDGRQYYDDPSPRRRVDEYGDQSYTPTVDLRDAERVATGGKVYPVLPHEHPDPYPQSRYWAQKMQEMEQQYDPTWMVPRYGNGSANPPKPRPRPRSRQNEKLDTVKKPAYNSHWVDVPFLLAWMAWWVTLAFPTMIVAGGLTSGLPASDGAVGAIVWAILSTIVSFITTTVSRWHHAHKTRTINRVHAEMDKRLDRRWTDRRVK